MDKLVIDGNKITDYVNIITNNIQEFISVVKVIDAEKKNILWDSVNYNSMMQKYDNMIQEYLLYVNRMIKLLDYLKRTANRYNDSLTIIKEDYKKLSDEYEVEVKR